MTLRHPACLAAARQRGVCQRGVLIHNSVTLTPAPVCKCVIPVQGWEPRVLWIAVGGCVFFTALEAAKKLYAPKPMHSR